MNLGHCKQQQHRESLAPPTLGAVSGTFLNGSLAFLNGKLKLLIPYISLAFVPILPKTKAVPHVSQRLTALSQVPFISLHSNREG